MAQTDRAIIKLRRANGNELINSRTVLEEAEVCLISTKGDGVFDTMIIGDGQTIASELNPISLNTTRGAVFLGLANPDTIPGIPRQHVYYITGERGIYRGFGNLTINTGEVAILMWSHNAWSKIPIPTPTIDVDTELDENSENPIANKTVTQKFGEIEGRMLTGISINGLSLDVNDGTVNLEFDEELVGDEENPAIGSKVRSRLADLDEWYEN